MLHICPHWRHHNDVTEDVIYVLQVYNPINNTWSQRTPMNWARGDFGSTTLSNGHILAVGGENDYKQPGTIALNQV